MLRAGFLLRRPTARSRLGTQYRLAGIRPVRQKGFESGVRQRMFEQLAQHTGRQRHDVGELRDGGAQRVVGLGRREQQHRAGLCFFQHDLVSGFAFCIKSIFFMFQELKLEDI